MSVPGQAELKGKVGRNEQHVSLAILKINDGHCVTSDLCQTRIRPMSTLMTVNY